MGWFSNLPTRNKFFFSFGIIIALLLVVLFTAYRSIGKMNHLQESLYSKEFLPAFSLLRYSSDPMSLT